MFGGLFGNNSSIMHQASQARAEIDAYEALKEQKQQNDPGDGDTGRGDTQAPAVTGDQSFTVAEDAAAGSVIGAVEASDNVAVTGYEITGGNADADGDGTAAFAISDGGELTVADADDVAADNGPFNLTVEVSDAAGNTATGAVEVDATAAESGETFDLNEDLATGDGVVTGTEAAETFAYAYDPEQGGQFTVKAFDPAEDTLSLDLPSSVEAQTLDELRGVDLANGNQIAVSHNQIEGETVVSFGLDEGGQAISMAIEGVAPDEVTLGTASGGSGDGGDSGDSGSGDDEDGSGSAGTTDLNEDLAEGDGVVTGTQGAADTFAYTYDQEQGGTYTVEGFETGIDTLAIDGLPSAVEAQTLDELDGAGLAGGNQVAVSVNQIAGNSMIGFGLDEGGKPISIALMGVTAPEEVDVSAMGTA